MLSFRPCAFFSGWHIVSTGIELLLKRGVGTIQMQILGILGPGTDFAVLRVVLNRVILVALTTMGKLL